MISITTWNINSVRLRMPQVARYLAEHQPDVLCLQEIKTLAELFPAQAFADLGYTYQAVHGQKGYHGVATVARIPFVEQTRHDWQANGEARHVGVVLSDSGVAVENVYIPAGGDIPDREANPKFGQKLDFLGRMTDWAANISQPTILVGDFNIAPLESDVWSHKALLKVVSHTPIEVETLARFQAAHGFVDVGRQLLFVVVVPLGQLARQRPGPPSGPRMGQPRGGRQGPRPPHLRRFARLGAMLRPYPAYHRV